MIRVGIIGVTGYTGGELLRILSGHPEVSVTYATSRYAAGQEVAEVHPQFKGLLSLRCSKFDEEEAQLKTDICFCALPHGESMNTVASLLGVGLKVIDLSADYRLDPGDYYQWYKKKHFFPHLTEKAAYGLPELYREQVAGSELVANPGCYPTASILALAPLAQENLIDFSSLIIDAKSGTSGAGRNLSPTLHYPNLTENFQAYKVAAHQHTPEIEKILSLLSGQPVKLTFTPHLLPMSRGILVTAYLRLKKSCLDNDIQGIYSQYYGAEPFIRLIEHPQLPETKNVYGSNYCDIAWRLDERTGRLIVIAAIDNLVKGASGQAVQNMNIMFGLSET
ncbi:MAG: N-acetyl-gamma-glutamyl-phosphate reductase, partial [Firmicutes bacterium]|nr:N-acetyl-gamma-glutamyl-phosphate reductase [Bacillota bacterium]